MIDIYLKNILKLYDIKIKINKQYLKYNKFICYYYLKNNKLITPFEFDQKYCRKNNLINYNDDVNDIIFTYNISISNNCVYLEINKKKIFEYNYDWFGKYYSKYKQINNIIIKHYYGNDIEKYYILSKIEFRYRTNFNGKYRYKICNNNCYMYFDYYDYYDRICCVGYQLDFKIDVLYKNNNILYLKINTYDENENIYFLNWRLKIFV